MKKAKSYCASLFILVGNFFMATNVSPRSQKYFSSIYKNTKKNTWRRLFCKQYFPKSLLPAPPWRRSPPTRTAAPCSSSSWPSPSRLCGRRRGRRSPSGRRGTPDERGDLYVFNCGKQTCFFYWNTCSLECPKGSICQPMRGMPHSP